MIRGQLIAFALRPLLNCAGQRKARRRASNLFLCDQRAGRCAAGHPVESTLAQDLIAGFKELIAHNRGEIQLRTRKIFVLEDVDVKTIRQQSGLSQADFAFLYGFNPRTLQAWEQGRAKPETAVLAYLKVISKIPEGVQTALHQA